MTELVKRPPPLTAGPGYFIRHAHLALGKSLADALVQQSISFTHYYYLRTLFEEDGLTLTELSSRIPIDPATATRVLDTMERDGLIRRERNREDRRKVNIFLTSKAQDLRKPIVRTIERLSKAILTGISAADYAACRRTLARMAQNVADID